MIAKILSIQTFILFSTSLHFSVAAAIVSFALDINSCCSSRIRIILIELHWSTGWWAGWVGSWVGGLVGGWVG